MPNRKGFTLVELLVVVAIIALLVAILVPALQGAREQARRAVCSTNFHHLGLVCQLYANSDPAGRYPPQAGLSGGGSLIHVRDWVYEMLNPQAEYATMFCPNLNTLAEAYWLHPYKKNPPYTDIDGDTYWSTYIGCVYLAGRRAGGATFSNPINSPKTPHDNINWVLAADINFGTLDMPGGEMIRGRLVGHVLGGGGVDAVTGHRSRPGVRPGPYDFPIEGLAGGNQLYNDGHVEWVDGKEMSAESTRDGPAGWFAIISWRNY